LSEEHAFILETWFNSNKNDPYPSRITKQTLAKETNITYDQVTNWFKHRRKNNRNSRKIIFSKRLTTEQKLLLKDFFKNSNYPKKSDVEELEKKTNLTEKKIRKWFAYERYKNKLT